MIKASKTSIDICRYMMIISGLKTKQNTSLSVILSTTCTCICMCVIQIHWDWDWDFFFCVVLIAASCYISGSFILHHSSQLHPHLSVTALKPNIVKCFTACCTLVLYCQFKTMYFYKLSVEDFCHWKYSLNVEIPVPLFFYPVKIKCTCQKNL